MITNYRPISLLPVLSKILERVVHRQVANYLAENKLLYEGQYGFRKNRSTIDAVSDLVGNILENFNKGFISIVVMLDMSKAFDCLDPEIFCNMVTAYGVNNVELSWFSSYPTNRKIIVKYNDVLSNKRDVKIGAPQGSILGPLCYIWETNHAYKSLKYSQMITYADDTTLLISGRNINCLITKLESDLDTLADWYKSHLLTLNPEKTVFLIFNYEARDSQNIYMKGTKLTQSHNAKLLGINLDIKLDWSYHINDIANKLSYPNYVLKKNKNILDPFTRKLLYHAIFESHLLYGISIWGPMIEGTAKLNRISKQQKKLAKELKIDTAVFNINQLIDLYACKLSYKYTNDLLPMRLTHLFEPNQHSHNTRNRHAPKIRHHTTSLYNKSFMCRSPATWLSLGSDIKNAKNLKIFTKMYKRTHLH